MTEYRIEADTLGQVKVPKDALWGPQTERSRNNFPTGPIMPVQLIRSLINIKLAAATVNEKQNGLPTQKTALIEQACRQLLSLADHDLMADFPLHVFQTGSGTQTNMNVNEVIANLCKQLNSDIEILPNDDVNHSQSSNDTFPTAMNISASQALTKLKPEVEHLIATLQQKQKQYWQVVKIGRTHLQDATPLTFGQEISGWVSALKHDLHYIQETSDTLLELPIGGTAVGTGLNTLPGFDIEMVKTLTAEYSLPFRTQNKFFGLSSHSGLSVTHGAIRTLAADLLKIANDIRFLASGPRAGYGELTIPANEPGSSIMPGKVNPTQAEAITMAATRVMGNDTTIEVAASQGNFEMNVYKPVIIFSFLESTTLLTGIIHNFTDKLVAGITVNADRMQDLVDNSLMTVTALSPHIGYHKAAEIAQLAHQDGTKLKTAAIKLGYVNASDFDDWMKPLDMTNIDRKDS
ncbi:class II fumarate hydratase [Lentilactobacillus sp. TOM.63]|uniref:class II fumarate hydratase n=1 Tax=Lentilactobacillus TaxID=2767893 RepID=UPI001C2537E0|nr:MULTISPECIES: class II fumarate hydratase [Lentilactobacillus]MBU9788182.1 class II fumarate hydratase [Lentilactobacillus dabitei]MDM7515110.1 class II fumarate hydratase [Lentilactobacillus sp. TOM.63]